MGVGNELEATVLLSLLLASEIIDTHVSVD